MERTLFLFSTHYSKGEPNGRRDALSIYAGKSGLWALRDRFGYLNQFSPYRLYGPHEVFPESSCTRKLRDIMDERAQDIISLSKREEKPLYLFVSGGVDSTAMTYALLKAADGDYSNLHIVYTKYSEEEYPTLFAYLHSLPGLAMKKVPPLRGLDIAQEEAMREGYAVTGWCADQLFGSIINQELPGMYFLDWRRFIAAQDAIGQLEEAFKHYGLPIKTFGEFAWFMNFSCKYDYVKYTDVLLTGKITGRMIPFYDTPDFQSWSVSNFDTLHSHSQDEEAFYKLPLKEYIFSHNGDRAYLAGKGKRGSWMRCDDSEGMEARLVPVMAIAMESPTEVRMESTGLTRAERVDSRREDIALKRALLRSYLKD